MHVSPMCSRILNMKNDIPKPHHGDNPPNKTKSKPCSHWIGFQQQILNYKKLVTFNKYLTKKGE